MRLGAVLIFCAALLQGAGPARAWCVHSPSTPGGCDATGEPCQGRSTHETIALRAAQNGGNPNGGQQYTTIAAYASAPDCEDTGWSRHTKHTSIGLSTAAWTSTNISAAALSGKWVCAQKVLGQCVWWRWDPDRTRRAQFIGRASHYLEDGGQPFHDHVVQSVLYPPGANFDTWKDVHLAFEVWAHDNGNFGNVNAAPTWFSLSAYATSSLVSSMTRDFYTALLPLVDLTYNPTTRRLAPSPSGICSNNITRGCTSSAQCGGATCASASTLMAGLVNSSWTTIGSGLKGVYRWNTSTALEPEQIDLYLSAVNDPATGYDSTRQVGGRTRLDLARVRSLYLSRMMTPQELAEHEDDVAWWDDGDINVVMEHPGFADPQHDQPITVINAVGPPSSPIQHPDYSARFLAFDRVHPDPGEPITITVVVVNEGGVTAPPVDVELRVDGQTADIRSLPPLPRLAAAALNLSWTATSPGPHDVVVAVDPFGMVDESGSAPDPGNPDVFIVVSNEEDNAQSHTIHVGLPPEPPSSAVQRFRSSQGGTLRLASGELEIVLPAGYSTVTPFLSASRTDPVGEPFGGGIYLSPIYSASPSGRPLDQNVTVRLRFTPPCGPAGSVGLYRYREQEPVGWVPAGGAVIDVPGGQATLSTNVVGVFAVIATGLCDDGNPCTLDYCSGGTCAHDAEPAGKACGDPSTTPCSNPDTCDGTGSCSPNHAPAGTACGDPSATECTNPDTCDGAGGCGPNHAPDGSPCGDAGTECVVQDTCLAGACRDNGFRPAGTACGDPVPTECSASDVCDGAGACSPNHGPDGAPCGDTGTDCIVQDTCLGGACQDNGFRPAGTACGDPSNTACTDPDTCDGAGACAPNHAPNGSPCGDAGSACVVQDTCLGGACQDNGFRPAGTACGDPSNSECTDPDTCDGSGACAPNHAPGGSPCGDPGTECVVQDTCLGGVCQDSGFRPAGTACGDPSDTQCTDPDTCDGAGACAPNHVPDGTACTLNCFGSTSCTGGLCGGGEAPEEIGSVTILPDRTTLTWAPSHAGAVHDVVRGFVAELPVGGGPSETCLVSGTPAASAIDTAEPPAGSASWYLVRARNSCGSGSYGSASSGAPRLTGACAADDGDSLPEAIELLLGTDPLALDTDGDGLPDGLEDANRDGVIGPDETYPLARDSDRDGLSDGEEFIHRTNPRAVDSDGDGIVDPAEIFGDIDAKRADTDGDGSSDPVEIALGDDPRINFLPLVGDEADILYTPLRTGSYQVPVNFDAIEPPPSQWFADWAAAGMTPPPPWDTQALIQGRFAGLSSAMPGVYSSVDRGCTPPEDCLNSVVMPCISDPISCLFRWLTGAAAGSAVANMSPGLLKGRSSQYSAVDPGDYLPGPEPLPCADPQPCDPPCMPSACRPRSKTWIGGVLAGRLMAYKMWRGWESMTGLQHRTTRGAGHAEYLRSRYLNATKQAKFPLLGPMFGWASSVTHRLNVHPPGLNGIEERNVGSARTNLSAVLTVTPQGTISPGARSAGFWEDVALGPPDDPTYSSTGYPAGGEPDCTNNSNGSDPGCAKPAETGDELETALDIDLDFDYDAGTGILTVTYGGSASLQYGVYGVCGVKVSAGAEGQIMTDMDGANVELEFFVTTEGSCGSHPCAHARVGGDVTIILRIKNEDECTIQYELELASSAGAHADAFPSLMWEACIEHTYPISSGKTDVCSDGAAQADVRDFLTAPTLPVTDRNDLAFVFPITSGGVTITVDDVTSLTWWNGATAAQKLAVMKALYQRYAATVAVRVPNDTTVYASPAALLAATDGQGNPLYAGKLAGTPNWTTEAKFVRDPWWRRYKAGRASVINSDLAWYEVP